MPLLVQRMIDESFDEVMPTVRAKALRKADELVLLPVRERWRGKASKDSKATLRAQRARIAADLKAMAPWRRFRAVVLYKMIPHDKSFWRCIRSKSWWALNLIGVVPVAGPLWWLLVFVMKDTGECSQRFTQNRTRVIPFIGGPSRGGMALTLRCLVLRVPCCTEDEYQLVDFIVSTESAKFFSLGCWSLLVGCFKCVLVAPRVTLHLASFPLTLSNTAPSRYYLCASLAVTSCERWGPRLNALDATFFLLQILLVWAAFWRLP